MVPLHTFTTLLCPEAGNTVHRTPHWNFNIVFRVLKFVQREGKIFLPNSLYCEAHYANPAHMEAVKFLAE
jgi:hypothetical protein